MPAVGTDFPHDSAVTHVTGRSTFIDDISPARDELFVDYVPSPVAHGKLVSIDTQAASQIPGVVRIFTSADVPGHNEFGPIIKDELLLVPVGAVATYIGAPVVLIAAESRAALRAARKAVTLKFEPLPPIFSIDEAIKANQFIGLERTIERGDVDAAFSSAPHTLQGTLDIGGQEHFYLESQAARAEPGESGQLFVQSSTQHPTEVQSIVAEVCGVPFNHVIVQCKRMGGGFGGKETQAAQPAAMAAMVATLLKRPARVVYGKDDDMRFTGKRHPFKIVYRAAFDPAGTILAYDARLYSNGGCTCDLSPSILERAMLHSDNAYYIPHFRVVGRVCRTNLPSNTAFRGFGGPQGVVGIENVMEEIAQTLKLDALTVRARNLYQSGLGQTTPYGQIVGNNVLGRLVEDLRESSHYNHRRADIDAFNARSRSHLRGLSMSLVKFGISFTKRTLNQANALVNIYTDGSVMVSHGGTEMGQGVHTRVRQIVADELGVGYDRVIVGATRTDKNHNTSPTAASSGTDLNGAAAADACAKLRERLANFAAPILAKADDGLVSSPAHICFLNNEVFDARHPERRMKWNDLICRAYIERINLGERGFYITPGVDFNRDTGKGHPFLYYTNGAAVSEVLIDRFTGETRVTRVDLLMDAGVPINPGLDRGQIVGGFIQGMGWVTTEELKYSPAGNLLSYSPTTYKIPAVSDTPDVFNVSLLHNPDNVVSIKRSKALGEPPLLLGISVWTAVKNALSYASQNDVAKLSLPATGEEILMFLTRHATARTHEPDVKSAITVNQTK